MSLLKNPQITQIPQIFARLKFVKIRVIRGFFSVKSSVQSAQIRGFFR